MSHRIKYPRTLHLPWSPGSSVDDQYHINIKPFVGREVVVTEKMDGENTTLYRDYYHARSIDSAYHPSRNWVKRFHASLAHEIPHHWRICGENLYAKHSIFYRNLQSYFYGFSVWNQDNQCLSWQETLEWFELLGITTPNVLYLGPWDEKKIKRMSVAPDWMEGYVVRVTDSFAYQDFNLSVAKWVRAGHVQTDSHWRFAKVIANQLAQGESK